MSEHAVTVTISGLAKTGKSRIAYWIENVLKSLHVDVHWVNPDGPQQMEVVRNSWTAGKQATMPTVMLQEITEPVDKVVGDSEDQDALREHLGNLRDELRTMTDDQLIERTSSYKAQLNEGQQLISLGRTR